MNYELVLERLIKKGCNRIKIKGDGLHKHRIIPGFQEGKYETTNISILTRKEHSLVHKLRYKLYGFIQDKIAAGRLSCKNLSEELIRERSRLGGLNRKGKTGYKLSEETKFKISQSKTGALQSEKNKKANKIRSEKMKNRVFSHVHRKALSEAMKGNTNWKRTAEFNRKMLGDKNSQYGTCWITNGSDNKKIKKEELDKWIELGYSKGRIYLNIT